jgi:hypothetical protein
VIEQEKPAFCTYDLAIAVRQELELVAGTIEVETS